MYHDPHMANWTRSAQAARPDFATLVAVAVARQSASATVQVIAGTESSAISAVSLVELFGERCRNGAVSAASFNSGVAALLSPEKGT